MALSIRDCVEGTIVDHAFEQREGDGEIVPRDVIRRGIIVRVEGNKHDSIQAVYVKYKADGDEEKTPPCELNRFLPSHHRVAKEAYRRITGAPRHVGAEFTSRKGVVRQRLQDNLALSVPKGNPVVKPEYDESSEGDESGIGLEDSKP